MHELIGALASKRSCRGGVVCSTVSGKGVPLARISVDTDIRLFSERVLDGILRRLGMNSSFSPKCMSKGARSLLISPRYSFVRGCRSMSSESVERLKSQLKADSITEHSSM